MSSLKILFAGTSKFAEYHLQKLIESKHNVISVFTQPGKRSGRGLKFTQSPVREMAFNNNIEIWQPEKISNKEVSIIKELNPDIIVVVSYGLLIPKEILSIPKLGCINVHPSLLPRWRGAAPIQRSIESGDTITGVTIMMMNEKLDTGDIIYQEPHRIDSHKKAWELEEELMNLGGHILLLALESILNNKFILYPQEHRLSTYAKKITKKESKIDWNMTAQEIHNKIMAFNSWPIAETTLSGERIRIYDSKYNENDIIGIPGNIKSYENNIEVFTKKGTLSILSLQKENSKVLGVKDFLNSNDLSGKKFN